MSKINHNIYISILVIIVSITTVFLTYTGYSFYLSDVSSRFFHSQYEVLKPSGFVGHGLGIIGSIIMIVGIILYMLRKRSKRFRRFGLLKHWLEFHIFLCTLGPIMILFHTSFKFGGIVSISFWSMVAVFLSGIIGRFIYIQIPRSIEGRELSLDEVKNMKTDIKSILFNRHNLGAEAESIIIDSTARITGHEKTNLISKYFKQRKLYRKNLSKIKANLKDNNLDKKEITSIVNIIKAEISLNNRIDRLDVMKNLFKYWHIAHLPFAIVMITIMLIHIAITLTFGYRWIF
jgi:hypothetical protein